jgi:hypothetical protein
LGKPLKFIAIANSTSEERNIEDNTWEADVRVIKRAELELIGVSEPDTLRFGGEAVGESEMDLEEDIGPIVKHRYTVTNHGPWAVSNVSVHLDWPVQVASVFPEGKWALYMMEMPTISTPKLDGVSSISFRLNCLQTTEVRSCTTDLPLERINPLKLKLNTIYSLEQTDLYRRRTKVRSGGGGNLKAKEKTVCL